ncbi:MAG: hypothetical protein ACI8RD_006237 [Bacillariaceae sp.]|jgi:hypothetical protein
MRTYVCMSGIGIGILYIGILDHRNEEIIAL